MTSLIASSPPSMLKTFLQPSNFYSDSFKMSWVASLLEFPFLHIIKTFSCPVNISLFLSKSLIWIFTAFILSFNFNDWFIFTMPNWTGGLTSIKAIFEGSSDDVTCSRNYWTVMEFPAGILIRSYWLHFVWQKSS